MQDGEVVKAFL